MSALKKLFLLELADRYDSEKQTIRATPKMIKAATCPNLRKLLQAHLKETVGHTKRLEMVFKSFGAKVRGKKCAVTLGLLKEGAEIAVTFQGSPALNAALVSVVQKIEHHEIASYGCLREWAAVLRNREAAEVLQGILAEEKAANHAFIALALSRCNSEALGDLTMSPADDGKDGERMNRERSQRPLGLSRNRALRM